MELFATDTTTQGRGIPVVVLAHPMVGTGSEAHASGRPVVYVEASMAAGEVDGTDGMLALIRDLIAPNAPASILDSVVVVIVPVANPDGNEARGPVAQNRPDQRGPDTVGTDANAQGLTLNRDFVKTEAPETRSTLGLLRIWHPDVYIELHTNDGSFTGFAYTYAPTLHPASRFAGPYTRDSILPELQRRMRERHALESFDYGTLVPPRGPTPPPDTATSRRWETFDYRARYGTNYVGLRNRIAILGVSYAHDTFERRVLEQEAFVRELLSIVAERGPQIRSLSAAADSSVKDWSLHPDGAPTLALAASVAQGIARHTILAEDLVRTGDSTRTQSGVPRGVRRTGHFTPLELPVWNRFEATRTERLPTGWLIPRGDSALINRLALHGIGSTRLDSARHAVGVAYFVPDSIVRETTAFQGHHLERVFGRWRRTAKDTTLTAGTYIVSASQPLGLLAFQLLDPESADGFVTWNLFDGDPRFRPGGRFPIGRIDATTSR